MAGENPAGFDLTAYRASRAEAAAETFPVTLGDSKDDEGNTVTEIIEIPALRDWPLDAQASLGSGNIVEGITALIGPEAAERFEAYRWTFGEFEALFDALAEWSGFQMGRPLPPRPGLGPTQRSN